MNTEQQEKNLNGAAQTLFEICVEYRQTHDARGCVDRILAEIPVGALSKSLVAALVSYDLGEISHGAVMDCACNSIAVRVVQITDIDNDEKLVAVFRHDSFNANLVGLISDKEILSKIEKVLGYKPHNYRAGLLGHHSTIMLAKDHFLYQDTIVASPPGYFDGDPSHKTWTQGKGSDRYFRITAELCYGGVPPHMRYL